MSFRAGTLNNTLTNCILWGNKDTDNFEETSQILLLPLFGTIGTLPPVSINNSCVQSLTGSLGGTGNVAGDPLFVCGKEVDCVAGTTDDDLELMAGSAAIDSGTNTTTPPLPATDINGNPRILNTIVDMGRLLEGEHQGLIITVADPNGLAVAEGSSGTFTVSFAQ